MLLRFAAPSPGETLVAGRRSSPGELDPTFLWEVCGRAEFGFDELAREYYGAHADAAAAGRGRAALHGAPMHFYKRGKGRYRKAPEDALKAALASVERKQREAAQIEEWVAELARDELPEAFAAEAHDAAVPSRTRTRSSGKRSRRRASGAGPMRSRCLAACGAIPSTHEYHFERFLVEAFPRGRRVSRLGRAAAAARAADRGRARVLDRRSHDDRDRRRVLGARAADRQREIGIHIAAPALAMPRGSALDAIARGRLSTVYMPGRKLTMLPEEAVDAFTLRAGGVRPALSLYVETTPEGVAGASRNARRAVPVAANLRLDEAGEAFANDAAFAVAIRRGRASCARCGSSRSSCRHARGKNDIQRIDYSFYVDWDAESGRRAGTRDDRAASARLAARQADRRADDPRQQHLGEAPRRARRRRASIARSRWARSR